MSWEAIDVIEYLMTMEVADARIEEDLFRPDRLAAADECDRGLDYTQPIHLTPIHCYPLSRQLPVPL